LINSLLFVDVATVSSLAMTADIATNLMWPELFPGSATLQVSLRYYLSLRIHVLRAKVLRNMWTHDIHNNQLFKESHMNIAI
jgi:hypothetical protein